MRHPLRRDQFRSAIARNSIWTLLIWYVVATTALAVAIALAWGVSSGFPFASIGDRITVVWLAIYGMDGPLESLHGHTAPNPILISSAFLSVVAPATFLGALVFKIFVPSRDIVIFRDKLEIVPFEGGHALLLEFYIASRLSVRNMQLRAFVRTYERGKEEGRDGDYPMKTLELDVRHGHLPLPFSRTPSSSFLPVTLIGASDPVPPVESRGLVIRRTENGPPAIVAVGRAEPNQSCGDFCDLFLIVTGEIPAVQAELNEFERFRLPDCIAHKPLVRARARFDVKRYKFVTENWKDY